MAIIKRNDTPLQGKKEQSPRRTIQVDPIKSLEREQVLLPFTDDDDLSLSDLDQRPIVGQDHDMLSAKTALMQEMETAKRKQLQEIERLKEEALRQAYEDGRQNAEREIKQHFKGIGDEFAAAVNQLAQERHRFFETEKPLLLDLAFDIAKGIVHRLVDEDPNRFMDIVDEALSRITDKEKVIIKVSSEYVETVRAHRDDILSKIPEIKSLDIQDDIRADSGACIIETKMGFVDASFTTQFDTLKRVLLEKAEDR